MFLSNSTAPTPGEVRLQLARLLEREDFKVSPRLKKFLSFVVEETLSGNAANIKAYTIAVSAFGRSENFDSQLDPIVRIEAGKLRKALEIYFFSHPEDPVRILIPKGAYVPAFSYAAPGEFPEPGEETQEPGAMAAAMPPERAQERIQEREERPVLMVLPISLRGNDEGPASFLAGLTDNLIAQIQSNEVVHILEAPPQYAAAGDQLNIVHLARKEGARFVLHGQAQTTGAFIRLYMAVTDAQKGFRIWTEKYDYPLDYDNLLSIQDDFVRKIFSTVMDSMGIISRTLVQEANYLPRDELGVYEATLRYIGWVTSFSRESYDRSKEALELNVGKDPYNPILLAQLSDICASDYQFAFNKIPNNLEQALNLAKKALLIDPNCHAAVLAKALYFFLTKDRQQLELILKDFPGQSGANPYVKASVGLFIGMAVDLEAGKSIIEQAVAQNPYQPSCYNVVPLMYHFSRGDYAEALKFAVRINAPACVWDPMLLAAVYAMLGQTDEARKAAQRLLELEPQFAIKREQILFGLLFEEKLAAMVRTGLGKAGISGA